MPKGVRHWGLHNDVEAVIFDFGGVITESPFEAFNKLEAARGLPKDFIRRINATNPHDNAWANSSAPKSTSDGFRPRLRRRSARAWASNCGGRDVIACLHGAVRPSMLEALRRISARFKTGCITNNVKSDNKHGGMWRNRGVDEAMGLFQHVIESSKAGIRKPDPRIYRMMIDALAVDPRRCIYLDDLGINLKPARDMGMTTIKVERGSTRARSA